MKQKEFYVINSFAEKAFGGNPAAVFIDAGDLDQGTMQQITRQMNLVETVFVGASQEHENDEIAAIDFNFRYFTPCEELPIAGHPTIAAALALIETGEIDIAKRASYRIKTKAGIKQVQLRKNHSAPLVMMEQQKPVFFPIVEEREKVAAILGISSGDLMPDLPIQPVDTGLGHLIVPVQSLEALRRVERKIEPLKSLCRDLGIREAQVFTFETYDSDKTLHTRNICPREGIEDPGCGVGNGALGAYLLKHFYTDKAEIEIQAEQGNVINMPCVINILVARAEDGARAQDGACAQDTINVSIGGHGKVMMKGTFFLD